MTFHSMPAEHSAASEQGATLIIVAIVILVLTALSAFVLDYGVMWLARRQAQNSADAGALAGAIARAFDDTSTTNPPATTVPLMSARAAAQANKIWDSSTPTVNVTWTCPPFAPYTGAGWRCVQVDVYRDGTNGSAPLPVFFARILGITAQGAKATASAVVAAANGTNCLRPWFIPDRFSGPDWPNGQFNPAVDTYVAPTAANPGTGYTIADIGTVLVLDQQDPALVNGVSPSFFFRADLTGGGSAAYKANISQCSNVTDLIGQPVWTLPGNGVGPTDQGVANLTAEDPNATWNSSAKTVQNSCAPGVCPDGQYHAISPRIVPVALFSPAQFVSLNRTSGRFQLTITNIMGFFVQTVAGRRLTGVIAADEGELIAGSGTVSPQSGFNVQPLLIR